MLNFKELLGMNKGKKKRNQQTHLAHFPSGLTNYFSTTLALGESSLGDGLTVEAGRAKTDSTDHEGCERLESGSEAGCDDQISRTSQHLVRPSC